MKQEVIRSMERRKMTIPSPARLTFELMRLGG